MNFFAFSGLINALAATFLGIVVYVRDARSPRNRIYGLYCLSIAVWSFFYCAWQLAESSSLALSFVRLLMAGAILIPILYFHHTVTFLDTVDQHRQALERRCDIAHGRYHALVRRRRQICPVLSLLA